MSPSFLSLFAFRPPTLHLTTEVNMTANEIEKEIRDEDPGCDAGDFAIIRQQTSETLQILRNRLLLLMPK
jgi:hypothetical protein